MDVKKHVVVVGGGFAGVDFITNLAEDDNFEITLVDKNNYNFFPPLLYQVATGFLDPSNISYPFRKLFAEKSNVRFRFGELLEVDSQQQRIILSNGELSYDILVIATGTASNYFGIENVQKYAIPMKTMNDAIDMRNKILLKMEEASRSDDEYERIRKTTIVVAGGGPTGVEISGMLAEMKATIFTKDYPELIDFLPTIYLVDGARTLLGPMSVESQQYTIQKLTEMGVKVKLNTQVKDFVDNIVYFANGDEIETEILIWSAGVTSLVFGGIPTESYGRGRRLIVNEFNQVAGVQNIYAIGDTCIQTTDVKWPGGHPQLAQVAKQQGKNLANNLKRRRSNKPLTAFKYNDKGSMAIIGRNKAVADLTFPKKHINGILAWLAWLFVHLLSLVNFKNKMFTFYNWMIAFFTKDQSLRMIIKPDLTGEMNSSQQLNK